MQARACPARGAIVRADAPATVLGGPPRGRRGGVLAGTPPGRDAPGRGGAGSPRLVHVARGVQTDAKIRTERLAREVLGSSVDLAGDVVSQSDRTARVSSPVAGRLEDIRFGE